MRAMEGFKKFLMRGNVVDLAVAVIIGAAFKSIIDALVVGVINPILGAVAGHPNFDDALIIGPIRFGLVLTATVNFVMIAAVIYFVFVKPMNIVMERTKKEQPAPPPPGPSDEVKLLTEIRDALRK
jgi:large conductance mechanosensitive channel